MRLLAGVLAGQAFTSRLVGDASLSGRPMRRVIEPLERMGARIEATDGHAPLVVHGARLHAIAHAPAVPSAQVKSAVLLAAPPRRGDDDASSSRRRRATTRSGRWRRSARRSTSAADASRSRGGQRLAAPRRSPCPATSPPPRSGWSPRPRCPGSRIEIEDVGLNPTRTALLDVLGRFGAIVRVEVTGEDAGEPRGTIVVEGDRTGAVEIAPDEVPALIDELPAIAALAAHGGEVRVRGASELRVKESDRIATLGRRVPRASASTPTSGRTASSSPRAAARAAGGAADARGDHRMAMAFAIAALGRRGAVAHRGRGLGVDLLPRLLRDAGPARRVTADKIYLVGFMAAGKTTLARALARRLDWRAVDIDELIEQREHLSVAEIFARHGEAYFRAAERAVLAEQLAPRHLVVATGGGTFADPQNRAAINRDGVSVWLDVPLDRVIARLPRRRPPSAGRGSRRIRAAVRGAARGLSAGAHPAGRRARERRRPGRGAHGPARWHDLASAKSVRAARPFPVAWGQPTCATSS